MITTTPQLGVHVALALWVQDGRDLRQKDYSVGRPVAPDGVAGP